MSGNQLKVIALVTMTIDHVGLFLFPHVIALRIIGRLSFPLFAYMVAEGCYYTHDKRRYALGLLVLGLICQIALFIAAGSLEQSIVTTLLLGALTVFALQHAAARRTLPGALPLVGMIALDAAICLVIPSLIGFGFSIDYSLFGILLPAFAYLPRVVEAPAEAPAVAPTASANDKRLRLMCLVSFAVGLLLLCVQMRTAIYGVQWACLASLILLAGYNGSRGTWNMKYLFYIYYPAHLVVLQVIVWLLG